MRAAKSLYPIAPLADQRGARGPSARDGMNVARRNRASVEAIRQRGQIALRAMLLAGQTRGVLGLSGGAYQSSTPA